MSTLDISKEPVNTNATESKIGEKVKLNKFQWRMVLTAGMGFFTDAYDLFIIGVVTAILAPIWHLSVVQISVLNGASLAAAGLGALLFGWMSDKFGRKKMYGVEVIILFIGAIFSALSTSFFALLFARIIVGFGIGGDYPSSAVVASESSGRHNRGFLVLLVFAMQAVGLIVGPLLASFFLVLEMPPEWTWRVLLALGAIPAASVFYLRRSIIESHHFILSQAREVPYEVSRVVSDLVGHTDQVVSRRFQKQNLLTVKWMKCLLGTAGAWFLLDVAFYGNGVSSVLIMKSVSPGDNLLYNTLLSALIFFCFAFPGYLLAAKFVDKVGRKMMQFTGFLVMAACYAIIAFFPTVTENLPLFIAIFGLSFFFVNFGPNATTFLIPSEIYPTNIRAKAHGISAATGKVGAFVGAFILPIILHAYGLPFTISLMSGVSLVGFAVTFLVPEMKNQGLEETEVLM